MRTRLRLLPRSPALLVEDSENDSENIQVSSRAFSQLCGDTSEDALLLFCVSKRGNVVLNALAGFRQFTYPGERTTADVM